MNALTDLALILKTMRPERIPGEFVFCVAGPAEQTDPAETIGFFREKEGVTLILSRQSADRRGLPYDAVFAWISLTVHSSLNAVGLTAAFSTALGAAGISCNVVAAFYHDHLFVPVSRAEEALEVLGALQRNADRAG